MIFHYNLEMKKVFVLFSALALASFLVVIPFGSEQAL